MSSSRPRRSTAGATTSYAQRIWLPGDDDSSSSGSGAEGSAKAGTSADGGSGAEHEPPSRSPRRRRRRSVPVDSDSGSGSEFELSNHSGHGGSAQNGSDDDDDDAFSEGAATSSSARTVDDDDDDSDVIQLGGEGVKGRKSGRGRVSLGGNSMTIARVRGQGGQHEARVPKPMHLAMDTTRLRARYHFSYPVRENERVVWKRDKRQPKGKGLLETKPPRSDLERLKYNEQAIDRVVGPSNDVRESISPMAQGKRVALPPLTDDTAPRPFLPGEDYEAYMPRSIWDASTSENAGAPTVRILMRDANAPDAPSELTLLTFGSAPLKTFHEDKRGFVFNAGAHISSIDVCPLKSKGSRRYFAVSTLGAAHPIRHAPTEIESLIQIWSAPFERQDDDAMDEDEAALGARLELGLAIDCGECFCLRWQPSVPRDYLDRPDDDDDEGDRDLGVLACALTDGSISLFRVALPETRASPFAHAQPFMRLALPDTSVWSLVWASPTRIIGGCINGAVVVYDIREALEQGLPNVLPTAYVPVHDSAIQRIDVVRDVSAVDPSLILSLDAEERESLEADSERPVWILAASVDGGVALVDLRDGFAGSLASGATLSRQRGVGTTLTTFARSGSAIVVDSLDGSSSALSLIQPPLGGPRKRSRMRRRITFTRGMPTEARASEWHEWLAVGSADGSVAVANVLRALRIKLEGSHYCMKLYTLGWSEREDEGAREGGGVYALDERFMPSAKPYMDQTAQLSGRKKAAARRKAQAKGETPVEDEDDDGGDAGGEGAEMHDRGVWVQWPARIAVTALSWSDAPESAEWIVSGTASGIGRIDCLPCE